MFATLINYGLQWLPGPLSALVALASIVLGFLVLIRIVKAVVELITYVKSLLGGLISTVLGWFFG